MLQLPHRRSRRGLPEVGGGHYPDDCQQPNHRRPTRRYRTALVYCAVLSYFGGPLHLRKSYSIVEEYSIAEDENRTNRTVWDDLDLSSTVSCGYHKCFVRSASNQKEGYIIAAPEKDTLSSMMNETELAKKLALSYDAKTFHIAGELPHELLMPEKTMAEINARVRNPLWVHNGGNDTKHYAQYGFFRRPSVPVVVQKMKASPKDSLLVHCADNSFTRRQLPAFIPNVVDDSLFRANLARDRYLMYEMLVRMPQLATDFQMLINTSGELYFIDFGGHEHAWGAKRKEELSFSLAKIRREGLCGKSFNMISKALNATLLPVGTRPPGRGERNRIRKEKRKEKQRKRGEGG